jgi:nucleoid-associated protein YgaU
MSALILSESSVNQGFSTNPSVQLNRRGRLARTLVVLSLAIVVASVAGGQAGANTAAGQSDDRQAGARFITVTVAPGDTLWSLAGQLSDGSNTRALVGEILEINSLATVDVTAGQKLRIPLNS